MTPNYSRRVADNTPWWVGAVYKVGIPATIALFLVYWLTTKVDNKLDSLISVRQADVIISERHHEETKRLNYEVERSNKLLQQICFGVVPSSRRQDCWK